MFKAFKKVKLRSLFPVELKNINNYSRGFDYIVTFKDNKYKHIYDKDDLLYEIEQDAKGNIRYIFDMADRIIVDKKIVVEEFKE